ncbi:DNA repair protein recA-like 2, mitochondrial [Vitis vinifera]|uniref:DNA repair protein recA-like 2, mitochondrial n=1 Tax=Vitis vinifera TaxID=29760 RepID=A0A438C0L4_VITVI|nr:DNA repair protein recA-like 2, mitochondrial [Vitis vinifera]
MYLRFFSAVNLAREIEFLEIECDEYGNDVKAAEKDTALRLAISRLAGDFGRESMLSLQRFFVSRHAPVISTGSLKLDLALGIGGLPKGRIVEIYGQEASGKTTLALHIIKEAQKLGGQNTLSAYILCHCYPVVLIHILSPYSPKSMGVNVDNLLISPPDSAENLLSMVNTLTKSGSMDVIVVDSVAALVPQHELDVVIGGTYQDVRSSLKSSHGFGRLDEVTCGGNALRFYAAVRLRVMRTGLLRTEDKIIFHGGLVLPCVHGALSLSVSFTIGLACDAWNFQVDPVYLYWHNMTRCLHLIPAWAASDSGWGAGKEEEEKCYSLGVCVQVVKNKLAHATKKADLGIQFGRGICFESEVLELACEHGVIWKEGSKYIIEGEAFNNKQEAEQIFVKETAMMSLLLQDGSCHLSLLFPGACSWSNSMEVFCLAMCE